MKVEATLLVKGILTVPPLQTVAELALVMAGVGLTVTVTVCALPAQSPPLEVGVTVYITLCALAVLFVIASLKVPLVCVVVLSPVVLRLSAAIQVNVDGTLLVKGILTVLPLQIVAVFALVITGVGLTVTLTVCDMPAQLAAVDVGVTV